MRRVDADTNELVTSLRRAGRWKLLGQQGETGRLIKLDQRNGIHSFSSHLLPRLGVDVANDDRVRRIDAGANELVIAHRVALLPADLAP